MRRRIRAAHPCAPRRFDGLGDDGTPIGPSGAIGVCKDEAPKIAQAVAAERGVMIGRTIHRLRNAFNVAPRWATPLMGADGPKGPDGFLLPRFAVANDGSFGAVLPIRLASMCLPCHGPADRLDPGVVAALGKNYPKDEATGFKAGDLRGWFWVEVPPSAVTASATVTK